MAASNDLEALKLALDFERRSVEFYENQLAQAIDPLEKAFLVPDDSGRKRAFPDSSGYPVLSFGPGRLVH